MASGVHSDSVYSTANASAAIREESNYYITSMAQGANMNPDLLIPGGAIKGCTYRRQNLDQAKEEELSSTSPINSTGA